jgi:hypothetical protein
VPCSGMKVESRRHSAHKHLGDEHVNAIVDVGGEKWLATGLAHVMADSGAVFRVERAGDRWSLVRVAALEHCAYAAVADGPGLLVVTRTQLVRVARSGQVTKLHDGAWGDLYPTTIDLVALQALRGLHHHLLAQARLGEDSPRENHLPLVTRRRHGTSDPVTVVPGAEGGQWKGTSVHTGVLLLNSQAEFPFAEASLAPKGDAHSFAT